jgi:hypothetical protein
MRKEHSQLNIIKVCFRCLLSLIVYCIALFPCLAQAEAERFISLDELNPGMIGKALSVFRGTEIDSFKVELQSIIDGPNPGQKSMLLKVTDESLLLGSGFSGSPVYFDGRLAGAISHMEQNLAKQMVMAVPISVMFQEAARVSPISLSSAVSTKGGHKPEPGSMIIIPLVRGDFWIGSSGTLTWHDGNQLLAFGHEYMFNGETVPMPIHRATVHGVIPKSDISRKEVSALEEIGSVTWDGKSAIVGRFGQKAAMTPFSVHHRNRSGVEKQYNLEMVNHSRVAPFVIALVVKSILTTLVPNNPTGVDIEMTISADIKGLETPVLINQRFNVEQLKNDTAQLKPLLASLFFPLTDYVSLSSLAIKMVELPDAKTGRIAEALFTRARAATGETVPLLVRLNGPFGERKDLKIPITIPPGFDRSIFSVSVQQGHAVRPSENPPGSIMEIVQWLSGIARSDDLVVLSPGMAGASSYPEARINQTVVRTPWNLEGNVEASIAVVDRQ